MTPERIVELATSQKDTAPVLTSSNVLYFASERPGVGGRDIYRAERPDESSPFGAPVLVIGINTTGDEGDPWVSQDERVIYYTRGPSGNTDIYVSMR